MNKLNNYYKGFNNIGNTCYLNSGLQLIMHNFELCENLLLDSKFIEFNNLILEYYNKENYSSLTPDFIKNIISNKSKEFIGSKQNDSFEFLIYLLELLNTELYEIKTKITVKCKLKKCLNLSIHEEKNNFLILSITNTCLNLDDCYRNYKMVEYLDYNCEKCKRNTIISKRNETN